MEKINGATNTFIVAVSGGVDSVVLLDMLVNQEPKTRNKKSGNRRLGTDDGRLTFPNSQFIVAHFDHGMRPDSKKDRLLVQKLTKNYNLPFEFAEGKLGSDASEAQAREARYKFLHKVKKKYQASAIITAHHQDDVIETAIINFIRGTNRKGISSLKTNEQIIRPLLNYSKPELIKYALKYNLKWCDDPSNLDTRYLRNYVRQVLIPALSSKNQNWRELFLQKIETGHQLNKQIDMIINYIAEHHFKLSNNQITIHRFWLIMLPNNIGREVLIHAIKLLNPKTELDKKLIDKSLMFAKTAKLNKTLPINKQMSLTVDKSKIVIKSCSTLT